MSRYTSHSTARTKNFLVLVSFFIFFHVNDVTQLSEVIASLEVNEANDDSFCDSFQSCFNVRNYLSLFSCMANSLMAMTVSFGQPICLGMLKWVSLVTMYSASAATAQSTNLLSSGSASISPKWI